MTIGEFKAFIEGMTVDKAPTEKQWALITEKMATLEAVSVPDYTKPLLWGTAYYADDYIPCHSEITCEATQ